MAETQPTEKKTPSLSQPVFFRPSLDYPHIPYDKMLTHGATRWPENVAVVFKDSNLTYRELEALTNRFANALRALGIKQGDRVCVLMTNRPEFIISFYAIARVGAVVSAMNPSYKEREIEYQINNSEAVAIVVQNELFPLVEAVKEECPNLKHVITVGPGTPNGAMKYESLTSLVKGQQAAPPPTLDIDWSDLVALPYSSGTTGLPKGVLLTHKNLVCNNIQFGASARIKETDRMLIFLPFYHIYGTMLMGAAMYAGATTVLMERFDPVECMRLIERHGVTLLYTVPPVMVMLSAWPELKKYNLSSIRHVMCGAAPLAPEVGRRFQQLTGVRVVQGYGLTEAAPLTHLNPVYSDELNVLESVGLPAHDTEQKVVDIETGVQELGVGEVGEICVRGPQVMRGYWKAPEATADVMRDGWYYSGDIARIDDDGLYFIVDRRKEMIKYKGLPVAPAEVESVLLECPLVRDAGVVAKPDACAGEIPCAFIVVREGVPETEKTQSEICGFAAERLAGHKQPREIRFVPQIPRNPSGKVLRRELKNQV